jgi:predicted methyltransferase
MLHEPIELSVTPLKSSAGGQVEPVNRMPKIKCGMGFLACAILALIAAAPSSSKTQATDPAGAAIAEAVADSSRPASDTARDINRKPAETLAFAGVKPGDKIADYAAGSGYFTRLFAGVAGPTGHVYASVPSPLFKYPNIVKGIAEVQTYAATHPNVTVTFSSALAAAKYPEKLDLFWISQNYHDLHDTFMGPVDMTAFNRAVYSALKPGGVYLVLDHAAAKGSPADVTDTLHRIEPSTVRREVEASGFTFEGESTVLANPADAHTAGVFDPSIQGRTDQFILKFRRARSTAATATATAVP